MTLGNSIHWTVLLKATGVTFVVSTKKHPLSKKHSEGEISVFITCLRQEYMKMKKNGLNRLMADKGIFDEDVWYKL